MLFHWFGSTPEHVYFLGPNFSPEGKKNQRPALFWKIFTIKSVSVGDATPLRCASGTAHNITYYVLL